MTGRIRQRVAAVPTRSLRVARGVGYQVYDRLARLNYDRELIARRNRTPAGSFRCYEPLNRHGDDEMLAELAACCGPTDVLYDLGANIGIYALAIAHGEPDRRVVAVEPSPRAVDRLRANLRANGAVADRIDVRACGVGDEAGDRRFYVSTYPELSGFDRESATRWGATVDRAVTVPMRRVDDLVAELPTPDVIKIDVEGAAPAVVRGARATLDRHAPTLFVEIHETGLAGDVPGETRRAIEDCAYTIVERDGYWRCEPRRV